MIQLIRMSRRFFSCDEVIDHILNDQDEDNDDLDEVNSSDSDSDPEEIDISPSTCSPDEHGVEPNSDADGGSASESELNESFEQSHKKRKVMTHKRLVRDIESSLDPENYDIHEPSSGEKVYTAYLERPKRKNDPGVKIKWTNIPPPANGRQDRANVITGRVGVRGAARSADKPRKAWELFFSREMLLHIVEHTNNRIQNLKQRYREEILRDSRYSFLGDTSEQEILAFIGLMYMRGLLSLNSHDVSVLFNDKTGHPVFGATMSKNRFKFLLQNISFDDSETRPQRWNSDRFAAFREIFEMLNVNCARHVIPDDFLSLDETLYPMRVQISFKQFNPSKPAKYGLLFKSINAARYPYTFLVVVYSGKPKGPPGEYYVPGTDEIVKSMVSRLKRTNNLQGRNISYDRLYTSIPLAKWLLEQGVTSVGTLKSNRRGIPEEVKQINKDQGPYSVVWEQSEKKIVLHSYLSSKGKSKDSNTFRNVLMLSTMQPILGVTKDDGKSKPAIYKLYDFTKGGTDIIDQRIVFYSCKTKSSRWTMTAFAYVLDTCRVNSSTVLSKNNGRDPRKDNAFEFGWNLAMELVLPFMKARSLNGLPSIIQQKMRFFVETDATESASGSTQASGSGPSQASASHRSSTSSACSANVEANSESPIQSSILSNNSEGRRRCEDCLKRITGVGNKRKKDNLPKIRRQCQRCGKAICAKHVVQLCLGCTDG